MRSFILVLMIAGSQTGFAKSLTCTNGAGEKAVLTQIDGNDRIGNAIVDLRMGEVKMEKMKFERVRGERVDFYNLPIEKRADGVHMRVVSEGTKKLEIYKNGSLVGTLDSCKSGRPKTEAKSAAI